MAEPSKEYPEIGLMTMAFDPRLTLNAIKEACSQTYPLKKITLYLLYQKDASGNYPIHYVAQLPIKKLVQINVPGEWGAVWMFKLVMFLDKCKEPFMANWDEDDYYEPDYINKAIDILINNKSLIGVWNHQMMFCRRGSIKLDTYKSPYGTLVAKTACIKKTALAFEQIYPTGMSCTALAGGKISWRSPLDNAFRRLLVQMFPKQIGEHNGIRWYVFSETANTRHFGKRNPLESIDYAGNGMQQVQFADIEYVKLKDGTVVMGANLTDEIIRERLDETEQ